MNVTPFVFENNSNTDRSIPLDSFFSVRTSSPAIPSRVAAKLIRALIVDDEPVARRILREELELQPDVEIVGEADTGTRALSEIATLQPDLVFLDLQMPQMGGLEVIQQLRGGQHLPVIVVVTAYDQYAINAFDEGAIDYLLKPVGQARPG
jgi:two-component system LytT family response regulator